MTILIGSWDAIDLPLLFFFSKTKLKPQFFSCTAPSPSKQGATRIVTRALCYPNTVFFSPKTEHLLHGREGPRKIPRRHYESNLCLFGSRLTLLAWCQVPGVNTPDTCERSATPKCINLPNKFSRPGTAKGSSRNQSSPSYQVKFFVPLVAEYRRQYFPWSLRGGGWGKAQPRSCNLAPLESPGRLAGAKAASGRTTRDQGGTTIRRPIRILKLPSRFTIRVFNLDLYL